MAVRGVGLGGGSTCLLELVPLRLDNQPALLKDRGGVHEIRGFALRRKVERAPCFARVSEISSAI